MSYLVLARKWRPKFFSEVSGQNHVVKALQNSLKQNKAHHAFLFAGTRGVGKTTIARLLAKSLNCEQGVVAEPCGKCGSCQSIDEGSFMDLIEVDAASQRGIDDTRELLENSQYTPTSGRFKVYLIDEVHQLTKEAFNALLKTLEEPPPHMKFLLATTESEKIPITVLSRCLKFNLKKISEENITSRLKEICDQEKIQYEDRALELISEIADGSMRDGLSLLDQALAYEDYSLSTEQVSQMLGTIDNKYPQNILSAILSQDKDALLDSLNAVDELYPDYKSLLDTMASLTQSVAFLQVIGSRENVRSNDQAQFLENIATNYSPELIQLIYQISITAKKDIELAPSPKEGFAMSILRMFAFQFDDSQSIKSSKTQIKKKEIKTKPITEEPSVEKDKANNKTENKNLNTERWTSEVSKMDLKGTVKQLASHCSVAQLKEGNLLLTIDPENEHHLIDRATKELKQYLINTFNNIQKVELKILQTNGSTLAKKNSEEQEEQKIMNQSRNDSDPNLQIIKDMFDAKVEKS